MKGLFMNSTSLMQLTNCQQRMNKITNNQSSPTPAPIPTQPMGYDTVSFKANPVKTIKPEVAKKGLMSALVAVAAFLGINVATKTATATATEAKPLTKSKQLAKDLREKTHIEYSGPYGDIELEEQSFNETAVKGIVKVYEKRGSEAAYELAQILDEQANADAKDTQYVIDVFNEEPELIEKYGIVSVNKAQGKKNYYPVVKIANRIKSVKINPKLTDLVLARAETTNADGFMYFHNSHYSSKIYDFVKEAQSLDTEVVSKYVQDQRIPLDFDTILVLAKEDKKHSAEIEEYIDFLSKNFDKKDLSLGYIKALYPEYIKAPEEVKAISTFLGCTKATTIAPLIEAYKANPQLTRGVCEKIAKAQNKKLAGVDSEEAAKLALGLHQYADTIKSLTGMDWQEMSIKGISKILSKINENSDVIDRIIADGRGKDYVKLVELYRRYPDREITPAMIERFHDPLAKIFDLG